MGKLAFGVLTLAAAFVGCGEAVEPAPQAALPAVEFAEPPSEPDAELVDQLAALGYVGFVDPGDGAGESGVVHREPGVSQAGFDFYSNRDFCSAVLMGPDGAVVNHWETDDCDHWSIGKLQPSGDLLVLGIGRVQDPEDPEEKDRARFLARLSWQGDELWRRSIAAHHDVIVGPSGDLLTVVNRRLHAAELHRELPVVDNHLVRLDPEGEELESRSLLSLFRGARGVVKLRRREGERELDLFHANSLQWMRELPGVSPHPLYSPGNVLVSIRHQNAVVIVDWEANRLLWGWGQQRGGLRGPHDAVLLPNGHILVFDNGLAREWSRVLEIDPRSDKVVWSYTASPRKEFYTATRGSNQRLANGNTLIAESARGHAFEVTSDGQIVWDFWNPFYSPEGLRATIIRIRRYESDRIESILERRGRPEVGAMRGYRP